MGGDMWGTWGVTCGGHMGDMEGQRCRGTLGQRGCGQWGDTAAGTRMWQRVTLRVRGRGWWGCTRVCTSPCVPLCVSMSLCPPCPLTSSHVPLCPFVSPCAPRHVPMCVPLCPCVPPRPGVPVRLHVPVCPLTHVGVRRPMGTGHCWRRCCKVGPQTWVPGIRVPPLWDMGVTPLGTWVPPA